MAASKLTLQAKLCKSVRAPAPCDYKIKLSHSLARRAGAAVCSILLARTRAALLSKQMRELKYLARAMVVVNFIIRQQLPYNWAAPAKPLYAESIRRAKTNGRNRRARVVCTLINQMRGVISAGGCLQAAPDETDFSDYLDKIRGRAGEKRGLKWVCWNQLVLSFVSICSLFGR